MPTSLPIGSRPGTGAARSLFLLAYACSGLASLIYQVTWTRVLTLQMGHTTAAASTVVAAFMGGLAGGAFLAGRVAPRFTRRQSLGAYIILEGVVAVCAPLMAFELRLLTPILSWAYADGAAGLFFPAVRLLSCLAIILVPAAALGATFPVAVHAVIAAPADGSRDQNGGTTAGQLYAINTTGAAAGAVLAGFILIPAIGVTGTTWVGVVASVFAMAAVFLVLHSGDDDEGVVLRAAPPVRRLRKGVTPVSDSVQSHPLWLPMVVLALTGFASLMYEIVWTRVVAMIVGPTTYAFSGTVAAMIAGLALGSAFGSWWARRSRRPLIPLSVMLCATALAVGTSSWLAGSYVPRIVAAAFAATPRPGVDVLMRQTALVASLILPAAAGFGAAFPLALALVAAPAASVVGRLGILYGVNTLAAVAGALAAGFITVPTLGLQHTLALVTGTLIVTAALVAGAIPSRAGRLVGLASAVVAAGLVFVTPAWDRELLSSGAYKYASDLPAGLDPQIALEAGTLLYYQEGAASTVSVKRRTGALSLAIDGKVDASNVGDMLTQKALAHLPLLLHPDPHDVYVIGLGSGVTLGAALVHPIRRADVVEISPEVVEASDFFAADNRKALQDPRTHLIVGDGRSHLALSSRTYDVIISEPSNPWMAGVAALFTREFFESARARLSPGGIICQWAHTYDISDPDLRSIVATFGAVFPDGTMWMVGEGDLLLVASTAPLVPQLANIERSWQRPGVADDLALVSAQEPFAFWSLFAGAGDTLRRYAGDAPVLTDNSMSLEFSGPRALATKAAIHNIAALRRAIDPRQHPPLIREALERAGAAQWRGRGAMLTPADGYRSAYDDYTAAVKIDATDAVALAGLTRAAMATGRQNEALGLLRMLGDRHPNTAAPLVAQSKLLAAGGAFDRAIDAAERASRLQPVDPAAIEQLASIFSDVGDAARLEAITADLARIAPSRPSVPYYSAAAKFIQGSDDEALAFARRAVTLAPTYAPAHNLLGAIYARLGQRDAARDALTAGLRLDPEDSAAYANLGVLELESNNPSASSAYFAEALVLDPQSETARRGLADARARRPR